MHTVIFQHLIQRKINIPQEEQVIVLVTLYNRFSSSVIPLSSYGVSGETGKVGVTTTEPNQLISFSNNTIYMIKEK